MGIQFNQTELVEKKRLKQDRAVSLEGLLLASIAIYGHFIWLYLALFVALSQNFQKSQDQ